MEHFLSVASQSSTGMAICMLTSFCIDGGVKIARPETGSNVYGHVT